MDVFRRLQSGIGQPPQVTQGKERDPISRDIQRQLQASELSESTQQFAPVGQVEESSLLKRSLTVDVSNRRPSTGLISQLHRTARAAEAWRAAVIPSTGRLASQLQRTTGATEAWHAAVQRVANPSVDVIVGRHRHDNLLESFPRNYDIVMSVLLENTQYWISLDPEERMVNPAWAMRNIMEQAYDPEYTNDPLTLLDDWMSLFHKLRKHGREIKNMLFRNNQQAFQSLVLALATIQVRTDPQIDYFLFVYRTQLSRLISVIHLCMRHMSLSFM